MAEEHNEDTRDRLTPLLTALLRVSKVVGSVLCSVTAQLVATERHELRRLAAVLALAFAAAIFAGAATGFAAYAFLLALGEEHRAAGAALLAGCFALLSGIAILLARGRHNPR